LYSAQGEPLAHCYVSTGHGSAGNVSAHLAAAVVCAHLTGDCPPLARAVEAALSPARFRERQARRGIRHGIPRALRDMISGADAIADRDGDDG
jgi:hypothetical protein